MVFHSIDEIAAKARELKEARRVAVAGAENEHVVEAALRAKKDGFVDPILIGRKKEIKEMAEKFGGGLDEDHFIDVPSNDPNEIAREAVALVKAGKADFLMKGLLNTSEILKAILNKQTGLDHDKIVTVISMNEIPSIDKLVVFNDAGIIPYPSFDSKVDQIKLVVRMLRDLGYDETINVAAVCAAETVSPKIQETVEAEKLKELSEAGEFPGAVVEGPISLDLALSKESAQTKKYDSPVAGNTDVLLFPNMVAGNTAAKMMAVCGYRKTVSMLLGAGVPVAMTSRAATTQAKYTSLALAALGAKKRDQA